MERTDKTGVMNGSGTTDYFLEFFIPLWTNDKTIVFFDPHFRYNRGDYFESLIQDEMEENIGVGARILLDDGLIFGVNSFYDLMQSKEENDYNQFGVGVEILSQWVDFRANYYHPFSTTYNHIKGFDRYGFGSTGILLYKGWEEALKGFDAEFGFLIPGISDYVETRVAGGGYWYFPEHMSRISGLKGRVEVRPAPMINLMYEVKHDDVRGTDHFLGGYLEIPFSFEALVKGKNPFVGLKNALAFGKGARNLRDRMTEKIIRDRNIVTIKYTSRDPVIAPGGDNIIYVNSDYPDAGFGTYEAPYQNIASVATDARWNPGAVVYVFSYDDAADTYNYHFVMKENTTLWGQGYFHPLWQLGGGPNPILDGGGAGNVITLADRNEIMGLTVQNGEHGIGGENITSTYIHDNIVRNNLGAEDPSGAVHIVNNFTDAELSGSSLSFRINNNQIIDNGDYGVYINTAVTSPEGQGISGTSFANKFIGNTVNNNGNTGIYAFLDVDTPAISNLTVSNTFTENTIEGSGGNGIYLYNGLNANNTTIPATGDMDAIITGSSVINTFSRNKLSGNTADGINVTTDIVADARAVADVIGNISASVTQSPVANTFENNIVTDSGGNGIYIKTNDFAQASVTNASVTGNITANVADSGIANTLSGNEFTGSGINGVYIENDIVSHAIAYAEAVAFGSGSLSIANATVGGNITSTTSASQLFNTLINNTITDNSGDGIYIKNDIGAFAEAKSNSLAVFFATASALTTVDGNILAYIDSSPLTNTFMNNVITGNDGDGADIENDITGYADAYGDAIAMWASASADSIAGGDIMSTIVSSQFTNAFTGNTFSESGGRGVYLYNNVDAESYTGSAMAGNISTNVSGSITNFFEDNNITDNLNGGIYIDYNRLYVNRYSLYATGTIENFEVTNTFIGNTISGNEANGGIYIRDYLYSYGTVGNIVDTVNVYQNYTDNIISGNTGDGIYTFIETGYSTTDNSAVEISMRGNRITGNTQNGVNLNANVGGAYMADLGTASSSGNNSLYDNGDGITYYDLVNNTGTTVNALRNWWGADADPAGQISNVSGTTNYDPWLTAAP